MVMAENKRLNVIIRLYVFNQILMFIYDCEWMISYH